MSTPPKSPVVDRLAHVDAQWQAFVESPAIVWCCVATPGDRLLIDTFIRTEEDPRSCRHPDLFLRFDSAVQSSYASVLRDVLLTVHSPSDTDFAQQASPASGDDVRDLVVAGESYHRQFEVPGRLVFVLEPQTNDEPTIWRDFVARFAAAASSNLALIVYDDPGTPQLAGLEAEQPEAICQWLASLDFAGLLDALAAQADGAAAPSGQFRALSTKMSAAVLDGDLPTAERVGDQAAALAQAEQWPHLACSVHLTLGAALASVADRLDDTLSRFRAAEACAEASAKTEEPTAPVLRVRARMAQGPVLFRQERFVEAATLFETTAPMAQAIDEPRTQLDCWRLASLAYELDDQPEPAWERGTQGLAIARTFDAEMLETSTFGYLGVALIRMAQARQDRVLEQRIEQELTELAGRPDWRPTDAAPESVVVEPPG